MREEFFSSEAEARQRAEDLEARGASASVSFLPTADERGAWLVCWVDMTVYLYNVQVIPGNPFIYGSFDLSKPQGTKKGTNEAENSENPHRS